MSLEVKIAAEIDQSYHHTGHILLSAKHENEGSCILGWSEKPKSLKSKNGQADYLPRHSPNVRTVFEI